MQFHPTGRTVRKSRGSNRDKDSYKINISYYLRNVGKNKCCYALISREQTPEMHCLIEAHFFKMMKI